MTLLTIEKQPQCLSSPLPAIVHGISSAYIACHLKGSIDYVCTNVAIEPPLQSLSGEELTPRWANCQDDASADIQARGFGGGSKVPFSIKRFFTQTHKATAMFRYHLRIGVMRCRRRGSMVTSDSGGASS